MEVSKIPMLYNIWLGTFKTLSNLKRYRYNNGGNKTTSINCRLCKSSPETPMHVMQKCRRKLRWRNERHSAIAVFLYSELERGLCGEVHTRVLEEPKLVLAHTVRLKPDLVVISRNRNVNMTKVAVINVTCSWESSASTVDTAYRLEVLK